MQNYHEAQQDEKINALPADIVHCLGTFRTLCSAVVALLDPRPGPCCFSSAQDLEAVMDYAGEEVSLQALHAMLNQDESDKGKNPWMSFVDDLLAKGPSTQQWMSKLAEQLRKMADELSSNNLGSATTMSLLGEAGEARKHFVEGLRAGLLKAFDVDLQKFAVAVAGHVVQSKEDLPHAKEDVKALQQALQPSLQDKEAPLR